jgi:hypothetical protein
MSFDAQSGARQVITVVIRLWAIGSPGQSQELRLEATHVQTGEVAYFTTTDGVARHVERFARRLRHAALNPPIDLLRAAHRRNECDQS